MTDLTVNSEKIQDRIAARDEADEILELVKETAMGMADSTRQHFLETLYYRFAEEMGLVPHGFEDLVNATRERKEKREKRKRLAQNQSSYSGDTVVAHISGVVARLTSKAVGIDPANGESDGASELVWFPLSQVASELEEGQEIDHLLIPQWLAVEKDLDYASD